jgi:thymidylate synthase
VAAVTDTVPGIMHISLGDAHVYESHIDAAAKQLTRAPFKFPKLNITKTLTSVEDIEGLKESDFILEEYNRHPSIKATMVA